MDSRSLGYGVIVAALAAGSAFAADRTYDVAPFEAVSVSTGISAIVDVGEAQSIRAEAPNTAILDRLNVEVRDGRLDVSLKWNFMDWIFNIGSNKGVVIHIGAPTLTSADAGAGADLDVNGMTGEALSLNASSGASLAALDVSGTRVSLNASSGGGLTARGTCDQLIAGASSGGGVEAQQLACINVDVDASSGGHASVNASKSLNADASSGGSITVYGKSLEVQVESSSGGSVSFASGP